MTTRQHATRTVVVTVFVSDEGRGAKTEAALAGLPWAARTTPRCWIVRYCEPATAVTIGPRPTNRGRRIWCGKTFHFSITRGLGER